jgi:type III secretory pathway lipoprotein EscJ
VLIRHRGATPPLAASDVQRLVAGAVPGLLPEQVSVVMLPAAPRTRAGEQRLARLGPLTVAKSSLFGLRVMVGLAVLLNAALLACVLALWSRLRRAEQQLPETSAAEPAEKRTRRAVG